MCERLRIAIADDDGVCREFLQLVLGKMGHEVVILAENGQQLVDRCLQSPPDLVITDVQMPRLDGIAAAAAITRQYDIPVVLLSGNELPRAIGLLSHARVVRRVKPISRAALEGIVAQLMQASAMREAAV